MSELVIFSVSIFLVLAIPGPTNALLVSAGVVNGLRQTWPLIFWVLAGYGVAIAILVGARGLAFRNLPALEFAIRFAAGTYLLLLARYMWSATISESQVRSVIGAWQVFVTSLLNPKALVLAFLVFPGTLTSVGALHVLIFMTMTVGVAGGWLAIGGSLSHATPKWIQLRLARAMAVVVAGFAVLTALAPFNTDS